MNPHASRHWILSPARLPFRHSRAELKGIGKSEGFEGQGGHRSATRAEPCAVLKLIELGRRLLEHSAVHDGVAPIDRLGFVACQLHRGRTCHARPLKVADGRTPEVMHEPPRYTRRSTCLRPRVAKIANPAAIGMNENPRDDLPGHAPGKVPGCIITLPCRSKRKTFMSP